MSAAILHVAAKAQVAESVADPALYDAWNRGKATGYRRHEASGQVVIFLLVQASPGAPALGIPASHREGAHLRESGGRRFQTD